MHSNNPSAIEKSVAVSYKNGYAFLFEVAGLAVCLAFIGSFSNSSHLSEVFYFEI